jgi:hypothetical protein
MYRDPAAAAARVHRFLGLRDHRLDRYEDTYQRGNYERKMPAELRARLAAHFEPHNQELFDLLGEKYDWA